MKRSVGILAYGSLIPNSGDEICRALVERQEGVMTPFNVEFARSSKGRRGAPTLIPVNDIGAPVQAHLLVLNVTEDEAKHRLYRREINKVGTDRQYQHREKLGGRPCRYQTLRRFLRSRCGFIHRDREEHFGFNSKKAC